MKTSTQQRKLLTEFGISDEKVVQSVLNFMTAFIEQGRDEQFRNPITSKYGVGQLREMFQAMSDEYEQPWVKDLAIDEWSKFKPRSDVPPFSTYASKLQDAWYASPAWSVDETKRTQAVERVLSLMCGDKRHFLRPVSTESAIELMDKSTNSGTYGFTRRSHILKRDMPQVLADVRGFFEGTYPVGRYILTIRAKEGKGDEPTQARVVQMGDMIENIASATFQKPMISFLRGNPMFPSMTGPDHDDMRLASMLGSGKLLLSGDISSFDMSVHRNKLDEFEYILKSMFQKRFDGMISKTIESATEGRLLTPSEILPPVGHFIKSGMTYTNLADSVINAIDIVYNRLMLGVETEPTSLMINGDDFVVSHDVNIDEYSSVSETHGMILEPNKQLISQDYATFNARYMSKHDVEDGKPYSVRSLARNVRSIEFPEKIAELGTGGQALRVVSIMHTFETNGAFMPLLEFYIREDERHGLGSQSKRDFETVFGKQSARRLREGLDYDRVGVPKALTLEGIHTWKVTQVIKDLI